MLPSAPKALWRREEGGLGWSRRRAGRHLIGGREQVSPVAWRLLRGVVREEDEGCEKPLLGGLRYPDAPERERG